MVSYGEKVLYMPIPDRKNLRKFDPKYLVGRFVGVRHRSDELHIMTTGGVVKAKNVRRLPVSQRWSADDIDDLKGLPWQPRAKEDGSFAALPGPIDLVTPPLDNKMDDAYERIAQEPGARSVYIRGNIELKQYGYTEGCEGCRAKRANIGSRRGHSEQCRKRIMEALNGTPQGRAALEREERRINSRLAEMVEEADNTAGEARQEAGHQLTERCGKPSRQGSHGI